MDFYEDAINVISGKSSDIKGLDKCFIAVMRNNIVTKADKTKIGSCIKDKLHNNSCASDRLKLVIPSVLNLLNDVASEEDIRRIEDYGDYTASDPMKNVTVSVSYCSVFSKATSFCREKETSQESDLQGSVTVSVGS